MIHLILTHVVSGPYHFHPPFHFDPFWPWQRGSHCAPYVPKFPLHWPIGGVRGRMSW
jgi:hypothetical protein